MEDIRIYRIKTEGVPYVWQQMQHAYTALTH